MSLDVHIIHNGTLGPLIDGLAINAVRLVDDGSVLRIVGQLFNATELTVFDSWSRLSWHVRSRFVIEARLDAELTELIGSSCLDVNVHTHATFVQLFRDFGRPTQLSAPHSQSETTPFCHVCRPTTTKTRNRVKLAICSVIRDEAEFLEEWIAWHELLGVARFFLYDDASGDATRDVLRARIESGSVTLDDWSHGNYWRQLSGINDCVLRHAADADWIVALDVDEFLFPPQAAIDSVKVSDLLAESRFADVGAVRIAWLQFSDSVEPEQEAATLVTARYVWRAESPYLGTVSLLSDSKEAVQILAGKTVFRPQHVAGLDTTHSATLVPGSPMRSVDADAKTELVIRHYAMRSIGARNRWDDTKRWKVRHERELRELFGTTKDDRAQRLTQELVAL
jgi:hypothetical protein